LVWELILSLNNESPEAGAFRIAVMAEGKEQMLEIRGDERLLAGIQAAGLYLPAICGGRGSCGKCKVRVLSGGLEPSAADIGTTTIALTLAKTRDGQDIQVFQKDVRELQLAKSAICSGVDALLHQAALEYGDVKTLYIAGGFGHNLDFTSGAGIGLIPEALAPKAALIGNSALGGTVKYLLDSDSEAALDRIMEISEEFNLAADQFFQKTFIENINFKRFKSEEERVNRKEEKFNRKEERFNREEDKGVS
jgi:uncharacterized 2Fe-2S/4Fe-4S cluster protein (DUF4445 family)